MSERRTWGTGSINERTDRTGAKWLARLRGQDYYCHSKREAEDLLAEKLGLLKKGVTPSSDSLTVGTWLKSWLEGQEGTVRVGTYRRYEQIVRRHLAPQNRLGAVRLNRLTKAEVSRLMTALAGEGLAATTIRQVRGVLRAAYNSAIEEGKVVRNPAQSAKPPKVEESEPYAPSPEIAQAIVNACKDPSLKRAVLFGLGTGLRAGEQAGLRWSDVDLEGGYLFVSRALTRTYKDGGAWELTRPKTTRSRRRVDLAPSIVAVLRAEKDAQTDAVGEIPDLVFREADGSPRVNDPRRLQAALKPTPWLIRADTGTKLTWDALAREGHASLLLRQGANLAEVSKRLGHSSVVVTARHYSGVAEDTAVRLGSSLEALRLS
jgi:integrase